MSEEEQIKQPDAIQTPEAPEDFKDKYFRTLAEMENMRKRMQKEKQEISRFAIENAINDFLPALDNLENALQFADQASGEVKSWAMGFQMILSQFKEVLHNNGISSFRSEGSRFDPLFHEAVEVLETDEHPEGTILKEFSKGYKSAGRVIRPARVKVAKCSVKTESKESINERENNHDE